MEASFTGATHESAMAKKLTKHCLILFSLDWDFWLLYLLGSLIWLFPFFSLGDSQLETGLAVASHGV